MELKPCPFCGGEAELMWNYGGQAKYGGSYYYFFARCKVCGASTKHSPKTTDDPNEDDLYLSVIDAWNRRTYADKTD